MEDKKKEQLESADERAKKFTALPKFTTGGIIALILGILILPEYLPIFRAMNGLKPLTTAH